MKNKDILKGTVIGFLLSAVILVTGVAFVNKHYYVEKKLMAIDSLINNHFIGKIDKSKMEEGIYKGFVSGVGDVYTTYYTKEEFDDLKEESSGVYAGIGVQMTIDKSDNTISITQVFEGSAAEQAGILPKDKIIKAAGKTVTGDDYEEIPKMIKGTPGTKVQVTIFRPSESKTYSYNLERKNVSYPTVTYKMVDNNNIGYIKIMRFEETTYKQFKEALNQITAKKAKGLILDVRNNGGGLLHITGQIADELIPEGVIVSTKDKQGEVREIYSDKNFLDIPIVVLVNEQSASASEVLSGALKDHKRAKLVGGTTFGKGIVQTIIPLSDGSGVKVTTSQYFTPSGVCIQGIGIKPDYPVSLKPELLLRADIDEKEDVQLQKGMQVLKEQVK